jgi:hypothetical protein
MFFRKKQEEPGDQFAAYHERQTPRYTVNGGISIEGFEGEGLLKYISDSGCCMESVTYVSIKPSQVYQLRINPGPDTNMEPFTTRLTLNWIKSSEMVFEAGFVLEGAEQDPHLVRYIEQLRLQGARPEYGNMGPDCR